MNDNQYICHSSEIICHAGKKGMKWGQGPYSKLKGYVKKFVDEKITGDSAQAEANRYRRIAENKDEWVKRDRENNAYWADRANAYEKDVKTINEAMQPGIGGSWPLRSWPLSGGRRIYKYGTGPLSEADLLMLSKLSNDAAKNKNSYRRAANAVGRTAFQYEQEAHKARAKAASARRRAQQSLFGRARLIFGNPKKKRG